MCGTKRPISRVPGWMDNVYTMEGLTPGSASAFSMSRHQGQKAEGPTDPGVQSGRI